MSSRMPWSPRCAYLLSFLVHAEVPSNHDESTDGKRANGLFTKALKIEIETDGRLTVAGKC
jgi:hypothetical protein